MYGKAPTYQWWILHSSRILHISAHDLQHNVCYTLHPTPWCTFRTNHRTGTNTHTALRHTHGRLSGMHCGTSRESVWAPRRWREDLGLATYLRSSRRILSIGNSHVTFATLLLENYVNFLDVKWSLLLFSSHSPLSGFAGTFSFFEQLDFSPDL